jgi:endonuclease-3
MGGKPRSQPRPDPARVAEVLEVLQRTWGHATCELDHDNAYQLLVATILSAQSTDKLINTVTPGLFERYPDASALAQADRAELERQIHSTGFFRNKTRSLLGMAQKVVADHGGEIPRTMTELVALPGVARKTANVVLGIAYGIAAGIVVDTHVKRLAQRLGFTDETNPEKIERDLMAAIPEDHWIDFGTQLIWHGRRVCFARKPNCEECPLAPLCPSSEVGVEKDAGTSAAAGEGSAA